MRVHFPSVERKDEEGIDYPNVPNTSLHGMCGAFVGPHFANPKSDNCKKFPPQKPSDYKKHLLCGQEIKYAKSLVRGGEGLGFRVEC